MSPQVFNDEQVYYNKNGIVVRPVKMEDIDNVSIDMRDSDINEIWASHHIKPYKALYDGWRLSILALTIEDNGRAVAVFGIHPYSMTGDKATVWFLASNRLDKIKNRFIKNSRCFINLMLGFYPYLENYVDARNKKSIEWLRFCGAKISEAVPYGMDRLPFHHFYFERV